MNVIIVGSGISGLTAAIGLRRAGHRVKVFEKSPASTAFGAGIVLGHNASLVLTSYGLDYTASHMNVGKVMKMFKGDTLGHILTMPMDHPDYEIVPGTKQYYSHRVDLQQALVNLATEPYGGGVPVEITYNTEVASYDAEKGGIILTDGTTYTADLVVAADGVHSASPRHILGHDFDATYTGTTIVRFMLPTSSIRSDPQTAHLVENQGQFTFYISPERRRYLLQYPVRDNTEQNFGMYSIKTDREEIDDQMFRFKCDQQSLRRELEGFHESIISLVPKTTQILPVWKLVERPPLPVWYRGRLLAIGDAVHPMLPNQGQGAGMAIEDSGALGVVFSDMHDTSERSIAERLALFEKVRKGRASVVQLLSSVPYFEDGRKIMLPQLVQYIPEEELPGMNGAPDIKRWIFRYDILEESRRALQEYLKAQSVPVSN